MRAADPSHGRAMELVGRPLGWRRRTGPEPDLATPDRPLHASALTPRSTGSVGSSGPSTRANAWQQSTIQGILRGISNGRNEGYIRIVNSLAALTLKSRSARSATVYRTKLTCKNRMAAVLMHMACIAIPAQATCLIALTPTMNGSEPDVATSRGIR